MSCSTQEFVRLEFLDRYFLLNYIFSFSITSSAYKRCEKEINQNGVWELASGGFSNTYWTDSLRGICYLAFSEICYFPIVLKLDKNEYTGNVYMGKVE